MLVSALVGWWGSPWGFVWTFDAMARNATDGGVLLGSDLLAELRRREAQEGGVEKATPVLDFTFGMVFGVLPFIWLGFTGPWAQ